MFFGLFGREWKEGKRTYEDRESCKNVASKDRNKDRGSGNTRVKKEGQTGKQKRKKK